MNSEKIIPIHPSTSIWPEWRGWGEFFGKAVPKTPSDEILREAILQYYTIHEKYPTNVSKEDIVKGLNWVTLDSRYRKNGSSLSQKLIDLGFRKMLVPMPTDNEIKKMAIQYKKVYGEYPGPKSKEEVFSGLSWSALSHRYRKQNTTLFKKLVEWELCKEHVETPSDDFVKEQLVKYKEVYGTYPSAAVTNRNVVDGLSWCALNHRYEQQGFTLSKKIIEFGLKAPSFGIPSDDCVKQKAIEYYNIHGKYPVTSSTEEVVSGLTWLTLGDRYRRKGTSLFKKLIEFGFKSNFELPPNDVVKAQAIKYFKAHGRYPTQNSGEEVVVGLSWRGLIQRYKKEGIVWSKKLIELGLK